MNKSTMMPLLLGSLLLVSLLFSGCAFFSQAYSEDAGQDLHQRGLYAEALANWRTAAEDNDRGAAYRLGLALLDGVTAKRDTKKALEWLKKSAKLGEPRAYRELGFLYDRGEAGLKKSPRLAARYYLRAARQNLPDAQYNIGVMYENGEGIDQDVVSAYMFYTLAIDNDFGTFAGTAREKLSYEMSRAEIELAKMRAKAFQEGKRETGLGGL